MNFGKRNIFTAAFLLIANVVFVACAPAATPTRAPTAARVAPAAAPSAAPASTAASTTSSSYPLTVTDMTGRQVTINSLPQRIISLAPSNTEILFALGLGPRVVAVDQFSDYPAQVKSLANVGGSLGRFDFEKIVELKPDLVLGVQHNTPPEAIKKLEELKLTVLVVSVTQASFESIYSDIILVGKATGQTDQAKRVTDSMKQKVDMIKTKMATAKTKPRVYWEVDASDANKPYTVAQGSFISDLIAMAGGVNIFQNSDKPYPQVSLEQILAADPQVIILADGAYGVTVDSVMKRTGWQGIDAFKKNRLNPLDLDTGNMVSRPGPRIVDGLEAIAKLIQPELFK